MSLDREMQRALEADGEKLRQLTGEDHGPEFWETCEECAGEGAIEYPNPQHDDPYFCDVKPCWSCGGSGWQCVDTPSPQANAEASNG